MKKRKAILAICIALLSFAMLLSACGGGGPSGGGPSGAGGNTTNAGYPGSEGVPKGPADTAYPGP